MTKVVLPKLTDEEIAAGVVQTIATPEEMQQLEMVDVSDQKIEQMARGFIMGTQSFGKRRIIRQQLEDKVTKKIGRKGKWLTDKLFELIEGVYMEEGGGKNEVRYYKVPPSLPAIVYALDRVLGKPKQYTEISEEKKGIILVEHVIRNLASNPYKNTTNERSKITTGEDVECGAGGEAGDGDLSGDGADDQDGLD